MKLCTCMSALVAPMLLVVESAYCDDQPDPQRKTFANLTAVCREGRVHVSFILSPTLPVTPETASMHVRILRREAPGFRFGADYEEYFDGMTPDGAIVLHDGALAPSQGRTFTFTDEQVEPGVVYAYWAASPDDPLPTGPAPVKVRHPEVWWSAAEIDRRMDALAAEFPDLVTRETFGHTTQGRPLDGLLIGNPQGGVALVGAIHAGESGPELILPAVERLLREQPDLVKSVGLAVLPEVNADEREREAQGCPWYLRKNAAGVDLNRNFDADWEQVDTTYGLSTSDPSSATYRGVRPESAPETQAVVRFIERCQPSVVFSYHALASLTGASFLAPRAAKDDAAFGGRWRAALEAYTKGMYPDNTPNTRLGYGTTAGSFPTWLYLKMGIAGFDIEWDGNKESAALRHDGVTPDLMRLYQDRHYRGIEAALRLVAESPQL